MTEPTEAELAKIAAALDATVRIQKHCGMTKTKKPRIDTPGWIRCPICSGKLKYIVAGSNNHITARCETAGCLEFMQ